MNRYYHEILAGMEYPPVWFDELGVPRWIPFRPNEVADVYAREAALVLIACQGCGHLFEVAFSSFIKDRIASSIQDRSLFYGDPPNIRCCEVGPTMCSETKKVLQYWRRTDFEWCRDERLEIDFRDADGTNGLRIYPSV